MKYNVSLLTKILGLINLILIFFIFSYIAYVFIYTGFKVIFTILIFLFFFAIILFITLPIYLLINIYSYINLFKGKIFIWVIVFNFISAVCLVLPTLFYYHLVNTPIIYYILLISTIVITLYTLSLLIDLIITITAKRKGNVIISSHKADLYSIASFMSIIINLACIAIGTLFFVDVVKQFYTLSNVNDKEFFLILIYLSFFINILFIAFFIKSLYSFTIYIKRKEFVPSFIPKLIIIFGLILITYFSRMSNNGLNAVICINITILLLLYLYIAFPIYRRLKLQDPDYIVRLKNHTRNIFGVTFKVIGFIFLTLLFILMSLILLDVINIISLIEIKDLFRSIESLFNENTFWGIVLFFYFITYILTLIFVIYYAVVSIKSYLKLYNNKINYNYLVSNLIINVFTIPLSLSGVVLNQHFKNEISIILILLAIASIIYSSLILFTNKMLMKK